MPLSNLGGSGGGGSGTVNTSGSVNDKRIAVFDGTTAQAIKDGGYTIADLINAIESGKHGVEQGYSKFIADFCATPSAEAIRAEIDPTNVYSRLDPLIVRNKIARFVPHGNGVDFTRSGCNQIFPEGTLTARTIAATSDITRARRCGIVSPVALDGACGWTHGDASVFIGDGTRGGFTFYAKFMISDATLIATARMFCGATVDVSVPTNVNPSGMQNSIGFGRGNTQDTMRVFWGGSVAQTPIDLGASFPMNTTNTDIFEVGIFALAKLANKVGIFVKRTLTGDTYHGILTAATAGTQLPSPTTPLNPFRFYRSVNSGATPANGVGIDLLDMMQGYHG